MRRALPSAIAATLLCFSLSAQADTLSEALFQGQVQQSFDGETVASCGVVVSGLELTNTGNALMFSGSFSVYDLRGGLVKGGAFEVDAKLVGKPNKEKEIRSLQIEDVWFKGHGAPRTTVLEGATVSRGEDPRYIVYVTGLKPLTALLQSISDRQPIQIGVKVTGRKSGQVLFGVVNLSDAQSAQLAQCVAEWSGVMLERHQAK